MRKRKGSSMVLILGIMMVLLLVSGIILKMTMGTMKANTNQKEVEDVQFAAEGGIEIGKSYLNNIALKPPNLGADGKPIPPNYVFDTEVGMAHAQLPLELEKDKITDVKIKGEQLANGRVKLTSEAFDTEGKNKKIVCELDIFQKNDNNIFDYGLVAGQGQIDITINQGGNSNITAQDPNKNIVSSGSSENKIPNNDNGTVGVDKNKFGDLTFLNNKPKSNEVKVMFPRGGHTALGTAEFWEDGQKVTPTKIDVDIATPNKFIVNGLETTKDELKNLTLQNIVIMNVKISNKTIEMLIANTKHLKLITNETQLHLIDKVLLNGGTIEFSGTGSIDMVTCTLYSEDIKADLELSFRVHGSLKDSIPSKDQETTLNEIIAGILPGWNNTTNQTSGGISVITGSYGGE